MLKRGEPSLSLPGRSDMKEAESPILNSPYEEPKAYYSTNETGELDYTNVIEGRRPFVLISPPVPVKQKGTKSLYSMSRAWEPVTKVI